MRNKKIFSALIAFFLLGCFLFMPIDGHAVQNYTAQKLKQILDSGTPVFLLNPMSEIEFNEGHIPGSVNIAAEDIMKTDKLPQDKSTLIVTYCKGPK
jgi:3-mercaptopyruvate sulfurtransferase SseA